MILVVNLVQYYFIREHKAYLKSTLRGKVRTEKGLLDEHNRTFINWLSDRVSSITIL